jgi:feruloyl esterase
MVYETDPTWDYHTFNFGTDVAFFDTKLAGLLNSNNPDLGAFQARGGKLIMWHGWNDTTLEPQNTVNYYNAITAVSAAGLNIHELRQLRDGGDNRSQRLRRRALRQTQDFARLFMLPGVDHCRNGIGPNDIGQTGTPDAHVGSGFPPIDPDHDLLAALDRWVDRGLAPDALIASHITDGVVDRTRPVCAYPQIAQYKGHGDKNAARNFRCVNEWNGFDRDFSAALNKLISNIRRGDFHNIPN